MQKAIAYLRVSTQQQEHSGLGLEAQRKVINGFAKNFGYDLIKEYSETRSGAKNYEYGLEIVLAECRKHHAVLIIAKLDRLTRVLLVNQPTVLE